jgi:hypothetical protein
MECFRMTGWKACPTLERSPRWDRLSACLFSMGLFLLTLLFSLLSPHSSALALPPVAFQAGEAGVGIEWLPNCVTNAVNPQVPCTLVANPISLSGYTVTLAFAPANNPTATEDRSCMVGTDPTYGSDCTYIEAATDFPTPGLYDIQFIAVNGSTTRKSPIQNISVGPSLQ